MVDASNTATEIGIGTLYVAESYVNLRRGPGTSHTVISQVRRGDELIEFERRGNWVRVEASATGTGGWIYGKLVRR